MTGEPRDFTFQDPKLSGSPVKSYLDSGWDWIGMIGLFQLSKWLSMSPLGHHMSPWLGTNFATSTGGWHQWRLCVLQRVPARNAWASAMSHWASRCQRDICFGGLATGVAIFYIFDTATASRGCPSTCRIGFNLFSDGFWPLSPAIPLKRWGVGVWQPVSQQICCLWRLGLGGELGLCGNLREWLND